MARHWILSVVTLCVIGLLAACADSPSSATPAGQADAGASPGTRLLPTLYPTATPLPSPTPADTRPPEPTDIPPTQVPFDQLVVDVSYSIPAMGLDRRIKGNVAGEIEVIDEVTGASTILKNRAGVILEMQQALPRAASEESSPDCTGCVQFEYRLPLTQESGGGWLTDAQILASLENYTAVFLGPHFPPNTVIGLRREATPYEVAHSVAVTADGQTWSWMATDAEIDTPQNGLIDASIMEQDLGQVDFENLPDSLGQVCYPGGGRETLLLDTPDGSRLIDLWCPELYLPGQLLPLYMTLSEAVEEKLMGSEVKPPELLLSVDDVLIYRRSDGSALAIKQDGRTSGVDSEGVQFTSTITASQVLSITSLLIDSSLMQPGVSITGTESVSNVVILRAREGVLELLWSEIDALLEDVVRPLDDLFEALVRDLPQDDEGEPQPTATATAEA